MNDLETSRPPVNPAWEKTHSRILESASHLFLAHGYQGTTMKDVAHFAGCSVGYLYKHFTGKQDLLNVLMVTHMDAYEDIRRRVRDEEHLRGLDCIRRELALICEYMADRRALFPVFLANESRHTGELRERMARQRHDDILLLDAARISGEIPDLDPAMLAAVIDGAIWGLMKGLARSPRRKDFLSIPDIIDRLIFTSLRNQAPAVQGKELLDQ